MKVTERTFVVTSEDMVCPRFPQSIVDLIDNPGIRMPRLRSPVLPGQGIAATLLTERSKAHSTFCLPVYCDRLPALPPQLDMLSSGCK
jgi:hypothetical protein